ncbi:MAG: hypothetical protein JNL60_15160, partial [Bacteroidia bacterium]|nr:hypothetical protein [Bacteroidia bacterium]
MKTILAGTDFTKSSVNACRYAALLAQKLNCKLIIFNLFQSPVYHSNAGLVGITLPSIKKDSSDRLGKVISSVKSVFPGLKVEGLASPYT